MALHVTHCIFDMDGLLLDTERIYTDASNAYLARHKPGASFDWELKAKLMGTNATESAKIFMREMNIDVPLDDYIKEMTEIQTELLPTANLLPGVERLITHLAKHNIPIAVATSSTRSKFVLKTSRHTDIFSKFTSITCGDDAGVQRGKPFPDIFLAAQKTFKDEPKAENCLVFEDATNGILAAQRAGIPAIWIPDPELRALPREGEFVEPTETLESMADFDPSKYGLPGW